MKMKKRTILVLVITFSIFESWLGTSFTTTASASGKIFWADGYFMTEGANKIGCANLDGSDPEELIGNLVFPHRIAIDETAGTIYWSNLSGGKIQRANIDGSNVQDVITLSSMTSYGIDFDSTNSKLYWADYDGYKIQRANVDGTNVEDVVSTERLPWALALDVSNNKVYYSTSNGIDARIFYSSLDGLYTEELVITGADSVRGLELDLIHGKMYWTQIDAGVNKIARANLDGSAVEYIVEDLVWLDDLALDLVANKMYWTIPPHGSDPPLIQWANLDGSNIESIITDGLVVPRGIELTYVPEPTTLCFLAISAFTLLRKRR
jgi:hypothetical protein